MKNANIPQRPLIKIFNGLDEKHACFQVGTGITKTSAGKIVSFILFHTEKKAFTDTNVFLVSVKQESAALTTEEVREAMEFISTQNGGFAERVARSYLASN